jgi:hypothetical protein
MLTLFRWWSRNSPESPERLAGHSLRIFLQSQAEKTAHHSRRDCAEAAHQFHGTGQRFVRQTRKHGKS